FFFQAEDGIRDFHVTGVQTCALPIFTSTRAAMRRLGRNWQRLHRLVYLAGLCATLHYLWLVKSGERIAAREPLIYFCVFALLIEIGRASCRDRGGKWGTAR